MNVLWYYAVAGKVTGPVEWSVLRDAVKSGAVGQDDLVWTAGYGSEWKKASTLGLAASAAAADAPAPDGAAPAEDNGAAAEEAAPCAEDETDENGVPVEHSVFMPENPQPGMFTPNPKPAVTLAFCTAAHSAWTLFFSPFSFKRWLAFSVATFVITLGAIFGAVSFGAVAEAFTGPSHEKIVQRVGMTDVAQSPLWTFQKRWKSELEAIAARKTPDDSVMMKMADDLVPSVRDASKRLVGWWNGSDASSRNGLACGFALVLLLAAYVRSWLVALGRMLATAHIYRRDAMLLLSREATRRPSAVLARALFGIAALFTALNAAILVKALLCFAGNEAAGMTQLFKYLSALAASAIVRAVVVTFVLDFVAPRILLEKIPFGTACARALKTCGTWFIRYFILLAFYTFLCEIVFAPAAGNLLILALLTMPFVMFRIIWALMIIFEIEPELCKLVPPLPDCLAKNGDDNRKHD